MSPSSGGSGGAADLEQAVRQLLHDFTGVAPARIHGDTTLQEDLGLEGDDAGDLMAAYAERFNVDLRDFEFERYFDVEGAFNPIRFLVLRLFRPGRLRRPPIRVSQLVAAAEAGRWRDAREG